VMDRRTGEVLDGSSGALAIGNGAEEGYFPGMENQADIVGDNYISCRYRFDGIGESQTKNAVFALGGDGSFEELFAGEWTLDFTVDYEDTMKTWALKEEAAAGCLSIKEISISPVSGIVKFDTLSDEKVEFDKIILNRKDGTSVKANAMSWDSDAQQAKEVRVLWESVVDLEDMESITVNGTTISL